MPKIEYLIHELAEKVGVTVRTIRYYSDEGLLPPPILRGKYAYYSDEHLERLKLIQQLKELNLSLRDIRHTISTTSVENIREKLERTPRPGLDSEPPVVRPERPGRDARQGESALDYIARVKNLHEDLRVPKQRREPPQEGGREASDLHSDRFLKEGEGAMEPETWHRIVLAPGIELHLREPIDREGQNRIQQILQFAKNVFRSANQGGKH